MDQVTVEQRQRKLLQHLQADMLEIERDLRPVLGDRLRYYGELAVLKHQVAMALGMKMKWLPTDYPPEECQR